MTFYKDRFGKWHKEDDFLSMAQIFAPAFAGHATFLPEFLLKTKCIIDKKIILFPNVVDYLIMDMRVEAIKRYCEIHKCTLVEARRMIEKIKEDMDGIKNV